MTTLLRTMLHVAIILGVSVMVDLSTSSAYDRTPAVIAGDLKLEKI